MDDRAVCGNGFGIEHLQARGDVAPFQARDEGVGIDYRPARDIDKTEPGRMRSSSRLPIIPSVRGVSGATQTMTSHWEKTLVYRGLRKAHNFGNVAGQVRVVYPYIDIERAQKRNETTPM